MPKRISVITLYLFEDTNKTMHSILLKAAIDAQLNVRTTILNLEVTNGHLKKMMN